MKRNVFNELWFVFYTNLCLPSVTRFLCANPTPIYIIQFSLYHSHSKTLQSLVFTIFPDFLKETFLVYFLSIRACLLQRLCFTDFIIQFANNVKHVVSNFTFVTFVQYNTSLSG